MRKRAFSLLELTLSLGAVFVVLGIALSLWQSTQSLVPSSSTNPVEVLERCVSDVQYTWGGEGELVTFAESDTSVALQVRHLRQDARFVGVQKVEWVWNKQYQTLQRHAERETSLKLLDSVQAFEIQRESLQKIHIKLVHQNVTYERIVVPWCSLEFTQ
jgi:hypothetical protein